MKVFIYMRHFGMCHDALRLGGKSAGKYVEFLVRGQVEVSKSLILDFSFWVQH